MKIPINAPPTTATSTPTTDPSSPPQKPPVWWIFLPFEWFFSMFPDYTPYFDFFYFSIHTFILLFGIIILLYSFKINKLSYLSLLMLYVGIRRPKWYIFYLYVLLWVGLADLFKIVYEYPPWKLEWPKLEDMDDPKSKTIHKKNPVSKPKKGVMDKIFDDVDSDTESETSDGGSAATDDDQTK